MLRDLSEGTSAIQKPAGDGENETDEPWEHTTSVSKVSHQLSHSSMLVGDWQT